ncbi:hypothetical protein PPROV_000241300 [Pycnococcus provasolii]|uniref:Uncharacterized protein n=1 Tax=Pycnococcus provasolii TaxID=41880 RepID=A0A830HA88_9CHLO|nr:hypothetical protein PPROV_000241300 [Pycnococcus provasolii]
MKPVEPRRENAPDRFHRMIAAGKWQLATCSGWCISSLLVGTLLLSGSALSLAQEDVPSFVPTSDSSAEAKQKLAGNILVKFKTKGGIAASAANAALSTILSAAGLEEIDAGMFPSTGLSLLRMEV